MGCDGAVGDGGWLSTQACPRPRRGWGTSMHARDARAREWTKTWTAWTATYGGQDGLLAVVVIGCGGAAGGGWWRPDGGTAGSGTVAASAAPPTPGPVAGSRVGLGPVHQVSAAIGGDEVGPVPVLVGWPVSSVAVA